MWRRKFALNRTGYWQLPLAGTLLCLASSCVTPSASYIKDWGIRETPGVVFTLKEIEREKVDDVTRVAYQLNASNFPSSKTYNVWHWLVGQSPKLIYRGYVMDDSGKLVAGKTTPKSSQQSPIEFETIGFARGEPLKIALVSTDDQIRAFSKAIPFPIEKRGDGRCRISVELMSADGNSFMIRGEGFDPNEQITTISESGYEVIKNTSSAWTNGSIVSVVLPAVTGEKSGVARYSIMGKSCHLQIDYEWGPPALKGQ